MIALAALKEWFGFPLLGASFVAIELSCISNFLLNDHWTFKGINAERPWLYRMLSFNGVSIGGMIINLMVLGILTSFGIYYIFAIFSTRLKRSNDLEDIKLDSYILDSIYKDS
jgi:dolichol-phosphate mannosyltransferase